MSQKNSSSSIVSRVYIDILTNTTKGITMSRTGEGYKYEEKLRLMLDVLRNVVDSYQPKTNEQFADYAMHLAVTKAKLSSLIATRNQPNEGEIA